MRCNECNKFVSYGEPEVEVEEDGLTDDELTCEVRVVLPCYECGEELKECTMESCITIDHECEDDTDSDDEEKEYELMSTDVIPIDRLVAGRHYFGAEVSYTVKCHRCGAEWIERESLEELANAFDEI